MRAADDERDHDALGGEKLPEEAPPGAPLPPDACWVCGGVAMSWRNCKLVCRSCGTILMSCADL